MVEVRQKKMKTENWALQADRALLNLSFFTKMLSGNVQGFKKRLTRFRANVDKYVLPGMTSKRKKSQIGGLQLIASRN